MNPMKQVFIVYDSAVGSFANQLKAEWTKAGWELLGMLPIPADEQHKTLDTLESICRAILKAGASRSTLLLAVGGGVTTDICGFAAAVFKRGMAVEYVPTTLLAQVDAAIGGKTGVNLDGLKNCLGVIRLPQKIHFRSEPLRTLPAAQLRSGAAEMLKTFALFDEKLYDEAVRVFAKLQAAGYSGSVVEEALPKITELAAAAAKCKEKVVKKDLFDTGRRHLLNFGHTFGHAIEWWQNTEEGSAALPVKYSHGEAVAIGMVRAAQLSEKESLAEPGLADSLRADFKACGLPTELPCPEDKLMPAIANDKKIVDSGKLDFVYIRRIGKPVLKKRRISDITG